MPLDMAKFCDKQVVDITTALKSSFTRFINSQFTHSFVLFTWRVNSVYANVLVEFEMKLI